MRKVLIVDDNKAFAENLAEILRDQGDEVQVAHDGREALALLGKQRFDVLLTDMKMPGMGGAELLARAREVDPGLAAVVISAYTESGEVERARCQAVLAHLPKPVPVQRLVALLSHARRDAVVAVVEDDPALADNLAEALRSRGFSAVIAHSVSEADRLALRPFAALVDLRVPGGKDGEALRRFASRFPDVPLMVISAYAAETPAQASKLFTKPFDTGALLAEIEKLHREDAK